MPGAGKHRTVITTPRDLRGLRATVMGLGLHGGGLAAAQFLIRHGARVTVTDLLDETVLGPSLDQLAGPVRLVLGRHEEHDFTATDLVIKNPGVRSDSRFLNAALEAGTTVENDISLFCRLHPDTPVLAVTGSKGKSTTAAALHHALRRWHPDACLGGNITVSPLMFADRLAAGTPVVLELSSWQLGDLPDPAVLRARVAILTNILPDHQDRYPSMRAYAADKLRIFAGQHASDRAVFGAHTWRWVDRPPTARVWHVADGTLRRAGLPAHAGAEVDGGVLRLCDPDHREIGALALPSALLPGRHNLLNLAAAALGTAALVGVRELPAAVAALADFGGLEHRLEHVAEWRGIRIVNDSAATMPHATAAAVAACPAPVTLIAGGNDKELDFSALHGHLAPVANAVLLDGTATGKLAAALADGGVATAGPFGDLRAAVRAALAATAAGGTLLFSPGATSFGMFAHEFERGAAFKQAVRDLTGTSAP
jgi:UDP-N-acetylmuramoylalanine--D-glutamate ligase